MYCHGAATSCANINHLREHSASKLLELAVQEAVLRARRREEIARVHEEGVSVRRGCRLLLLGRSLACLLLALLGCSLLATAEHGHCLRAHHKARHSRGRRRNERVGAARANWSTRGEQPESDALGTSEIVRMHVNVRRLAAVTYLTSMAARMRRYSIQDRVGDREMCVMLEYVRTYTF